MMRFSPSDYVLRPVDYLIAVLLLGLGFLVREFVFRASGSLWEDLRHLFDIAVPSELEGVADRVRGTSLPPQKRRGCPRCGSAMVFGSKGCDTCQRLGIPPAPVRPTWEPPDDVPLVDFASHATWTSARAVPHRILGPAVLRLKLAMAAILLSAGWNLIVSGFTSLGWLRIFLVTAATMDVLLLFVLRRKSARALGVAIAMGLATGTIEFLNPTFGWMLAGIQALALVAVSQALPAVWQLRRADGAGETRRAA